MLSTHLMFEEIADRLHVSKHTVKAQVVSIYGKLDVSSRGEAVDRAIEIGLLEPFSGLRFAGRPQMDRTPPGPSRPRRTGPDPGSATGNA
jgi:hypothetical protein